MRAALKPILLNSYRSQVTRYLRGVQPYHWWDFIANRALWMGNNIGAISNTPNWTFTRASTAYYTNSDGTLTSFASGALRTGDRGALIEGARTNICLQSQTFDNASWTNSTATVASGQTTGPDRLTSGWKLTSQGSGSRITQDIVATATTHLFYVILKYGNTTTQTLLLRNNTSATNLQQTVFNLQAGTKADVTGTNSSITALGNGWYICAVWATTGITIGNTLLCYIYTGGSGSSSGDFSYAWHAQLENGAFPSSPIVTTTGSATRAADVLTVTSPGLVYPLSLWAEFERGVDTNGSETLIGVSNTSNDRAQLYITSDLAGALVVAGGVVQSAFTCSGAISVNVATKYAARFQTDDVRVTKGANTNQDTTATMPAVPNTISIGRFGGEELFGYIRRAAIFNSALSDAQLQATTSA